MVPIAVETFGVWGPEGAHLIKSIGKRYKTQLEKSAQLFSFSKVCQMAVQRGNAASVLGTVKSGEKLDKIFHLYDRRILT